MNTLELEKVKKEKTSSFQSLNCTPNINTIICYFVNIILKLTEMIECCKGLL